MKMSATLIVLLVLGLSFTDGAPHRTINGREASGPHNRDALVQLILRRTCVGNCTVCPLTRNCKDQ
nr:conotoxin precursor Cerm03 [Conus ebraeus]UMA82927.1 conotoxin precursor Cerm03 [Conus ebraeus]